MSTFFFWSQVLALVSMVISVAAAQMKNLRTIRGLLFISALFRGTHFFLLGLPQAGLVTMITGTRWLASIFTLRRWIMVAFIVLTIGVGLLRSDSLISMLPIISGVLGTLAAFTAKDRRMRIYLIIALVLWTIHNIVVFTPVGILSSGFFLVSTIIGYERFYHHDHIQLFSYQPVHNEKCPAKQEQLGKTTTV